MDNSILACGSKIHNLFAFNAIPSPKPTYLTTDLSPVSEANLWHYHMCHINFNSLETMSKHQLVEGLNQKVNYNQNLKCCYTPCNTIPELRSLFPLDPCSFPRHLLCTHYSSILHSNFDPWFCSRNSVCPTLPNVPFSMPTPHLPWLRIP